jgi:1-aminocyclopropane-1-carboxylate deaminase
MNTDLIRLQQLSLPFQTDLHLHILRLDLIDEIISGNKWFKLKQNIARAKEQQFNGIVTLGGAYSNHIAATAKACRLNGIEAIGIIRGEEVQNHTLAEAISNGMRLIFADRNLYRNKEALYQHLRQQIDVNQYYFIPEGGANQEGLEGCKEITSFISIPFDAIALSCGTGTTLSGMVNTLNNGQFAYGFASMKGGTFLNESIKNRLPSDKHHLFKIIADYHFGGYAKYNDQLFGFMREFKQQYHFELDFVYTAKMMYGLFEMIKKQQLHGHKNIIAIHSGGLQGNKSMNI